MERSSSAPTMEGMYPGQLVGGRYRLDAPLGRGGMGQVFRASDERLERPVALKAVDLTQSGNPTLGERFRRESVATARLNHPNIVTIYDAGSDGRVAWLVMELLPGRSVAHMLREQGRLAPQEAVHIARRIADALVATHAIGVVHRDVKPSNVMVDGPRVKLLDFGIAQVSLNAESYLTAPATTLGTAAYMSPEQAQGMRATPASDVYALGGVLVAMLTGEPPYPGDNAIQVTNRHLTEPVVSVRARRPEVSPALDDLVTRMLAKDPAARPSTDVVARALAHLEDNPGTGATTVLPVAAGASAAPTAPPPAPPPTAAPAAVAATAVFPHATRVDVPERAGATRVQPAVTRVQPAASQPRAVDGPAGPPPPSAQRVRSGVDTGGGGRQVDTRRLRTAALWLGLLIAALLVFAVSWAIGSQVFQAVQATPSPAASGANPSREPSPEPTSTRPSTTPTSPPSNGDPGSLPSFDLPTGSSEVGLAAALTGVDAALSVAEGLGGPESADAIADLKKRWADESDKIADGNNPGQRVDNFADRVGRAREKGDLNRLQYETIRASLDLVRAAL